MKTYDGCMSRLAGFRERVRELHEWIDRYEANPDRPDWELAAIREAVNEFKTSAPAEVVDMCCDVGEHLKANREMQEHIIGLDAAKAEARTSEELARLESQLGFARAAAMELCGVAWGNADAE
jgi:hypothetical protein